MGETMPQIAGWSQIPAGIRQHLVQRMHDRNIGLEDLSRLREWIESRPDVPDGDWYKDFGSFKLCGQGRYPKTFLLPGQPAARIAQTTGARAEIADALNDPDGTGHIHARADGTTLVLTSEYYFDSPQRRTMGIQAISDVLSKYHQKLCDADFANIQFKGKNPVKTVPVRCK